MPGKKDISAIRGIVRQLLRDEFKSSDVDYEFPDDEIDIHIGEVLTEISQVRPYESRETVTSDGTKEVDISDIEGLLEIVKAEYPTGNDPPDYCKVSVFGGTARLDTTPTSGENVYLYCHKVHELTESSSTLDPIMEKVLVEGTVAKAALAWLNKMRAQIVPQSARWYHQWANSHLMLYHNSLNGLSRPRSWGF